MPNITALADIVLADDNAAGFGTTPTGATTQAILTLEDNAIRWGSVDFLPTATTGPLMNPGETLLFVGNDYGSFLKQFRIINNTAGSNGVLRGVFMTGFDKA